MSSRSAAIDSVRVLGIVAVVAGHSLNTPLVRPLFFTWHVPLFFFLAGYFWSARRTMPEELSKRARTLGLPYATWMLLIAMIFIPLDAILEPFTVDRILGPLYNGVHSAMPFTTFWFVSALFFTVLALRLLWRLPQVVVWAIAVAGLVLGYVAGNALAQTPLALGSALPCFFFVLAGNASAKVRPLVKKPGMVGLVLLALAAALIASGLAAPLDIKQGDYGTPVISALVAVTISFALILLSETVFGYLPSSAARVVTSLSYAGFTVVLVHPLIIWLMLKFAGNPADWLIFALALTVPWLVGMLALRTPASSWLTGVRQPGRSRPLVGGR
ncbi:MAG: acyltransferase family protein [Microbacteriaceae bacterium]